MRNGFSLIEIMVGMLVFAMGVLALTASTGFVNMQIRAADVRTERQVALQQATARLEATNYTSLADRAQGSAVELGEYSVWWDVTSLSFTLSEVEIYSEGPGISGGRRVAGVVDTLTIRIARPIR